MELIGKTVNIKDKSLLQFFYPEFIVKDIVFFDNENRVIYTGKTQRNLKEFLDNNTKEFINTVGMCDIDLDVKENLVNFVYDKFGKVPKEKTMELILNLNSIDFDNYIKKYWITGVSTLDTATVGIFDLFIAMGVSKQESIKVYLTLKEFYPIGVIQNSVETFIEKVIMFPELTVGYKYHNLLKKFKTQHERKLKQVLYNYYMMREDKEVKLMWLLYQF